MEQFLLILRMFKKTRTFVILYFITVIVCVFILLTQSKQCIHLWINSHNNIFCDLFFKYFTNIGDGLFAIIFSILFLFWKYGHAIITFITYLISSLVVQLIKNWVYPSAIRPKAFFMNHASLHLVKGVEVYMYQSFPSGHTATAFAFFLTLSLLIKNNKYQWPCFFCALLVGYSRMYLSQHFLIDVLAGSFISVILVFVLYYFYTKYHQNWMEKNLLPLFKMSHG